MAVRKTTDLGGALTRLDAAVKAGDAAVAKSLQAGATAAALAKLAKIAGPIPPELASWFRWHDGQKGTRAIGPSETDQLLSTKGAADAWTFLAEEANAPWKATWLPLTTNGGGDHLVYDRASGHLVRYYHDDTKRPKAAPSLAHWALAIAESWESVVASKQPVGAPLGWTAVASPKAKDLKKLPDGTAFHFRATSNLGKGLFFHLFWKQRSDTWFQATNSTLERAWTAISNNLVPFQATPDRGMEYCLSREKVFVDGSGAAHAGLFSQHFAKPPFPPKR